MRRSICADFFFSNIPALPKDADFIIAGDGPLLLLTIGVVNRAEEAHQTKTRLLLPARVTYKNSSTIYRVIITIMIVSHN